MTKQRLTVVGLVMMFAAVAIAATATAKTPRGVAPAEMARFAGSVFECGSGRDSRKIPAALVNDDFCDCPEGTDEPGTSACATGWFYCRNRLHRPEYVPSSRVNDGICDCCDGSDEWAGIVACKQTCRELGAATRQREKEELATMQRGLELRAAAAGKAQADLAAKRGELNTLKTRLADEESALQRLEEVKARVQEAENKKADEIKAKEPVMEPAPTMEEAKAAVGWEAPSAATGGGDDDDVAPPPLPTAQPADGDQQHDSVQPETPPENPELTALKEDHGEHGNEENNDEDEDEPDADSMWWKVKTFVVGDKWRGKPALWRRTVYPAVWAWRRCHELYSGELYEDGDEDFWSPPPPAAAVVTNKTRKAQSDVDAARHKTEDTKAEVQKLEKLLATDFGSDSCFYSLYGTCFEVQKDEYEYELCPFDKTTQKGGSHTSLGTWGKWVPSSTGNSMLFENGLRCWNGPDRTVKVELQCGLENKLLDASEPARCEYAMKMTTPCACTQQALDAITAVIKQHEIDDRED